MINLGFQLIHSSDLWDVLYTLECDQSILGWRRRAVSKSHAGGKLQNVKPITGN